MTRKLGVYVCSGCGIGDCLKTDRLAEIAKDELGAAVVRSSAAFCLEDVQLIRDDVANEGVEAVVIAACSQRVNTDVFAFPEATVDRINIREQVVWCHNAEDPETQSMAEDHLRMGVARSLKRKPPVPYVESNERRILVVGGGVAGLNAALNAARGGFDVVLVEREARLGGVAARLHRQYPKHPPYQAPEEIPLEQLVASVEAEDRIQVYAGSRVARVSGEPGHFEVTVARNGTPLTFVVGAIVLATGWKPADEARLQRYGYGRVPNVITSLELEDMMMKGAVRRPSDGGAIKTIALINVDDATDEQQIPYSGNVESLVALKQALYLRAGDPDRQVYVAYRYMHAPGLNEYFYKSAQQDEGIFLTRATDRSVSRGEDGRVFVDLDSTLLGGRLKIAVDLVVLGTGMEPAAPETDGLNLAYLQGEGLPVNRFGYADSNFICFPYETRRTGIYSAGCVRKAMDLAESARDGAAAALKAIQCIEQSSAGSAVHPRVGDLTYPEILTRHCTQCWRCTQECPFGAIEVDQATRTPRVNPNRCRRCGTCMGCCPMQVISFADYSVDILSSMVRASTLPEGDDAAPRVLVLACENDAYPAIDMAGVNRAALPSSVRIVPVRCLGSVNRALVADAVIMGYDAVALMGCRSGEDYQCHFIHGSEVLQTRIANIREVLDRLALESERVQFLEVQISEADRIPEMLNAIVEKARALGTSPLRYTVE
ncbi:MAG: hydrogenase iron-sulfur subunit [Rhodospirillales bacterium]|nr:hydrogenase iron-sulfur subunit [Rhodospirillales bacterium]